MHYLWSGGAKDKRFDAHQAQKFGEKDAKEKVSSADVRWWNEDFEELSL